MRLHFIRRRVCSLPFIFESSQTFQAFGGGLAGYFELRAGAQDQPAFEGLSPFWGSSYRVTREQGAKHSFPSTNLKVTATGSDSSGLQAWSQIWQTQWSDFRRASSLFSCIIFVYIEFDASLLSVLFSNVLFSLMKPWLQHQQLRLEDLYCQLAWTIPTPFSLNPTST